MILYFIFNDCYGVFGFFLVVVLYLISGRRDVVVVYVCVEDILDFVLVEYLIKVC